MCLRGLRGRTSKTARAPTRLASGCAENHCCRQGIEGIGSAVCSDYSEILTDGLRTVSQLVQQAAPPCSQGRRHHLAHSAFNFDIVRQEKPFGALVITMAQFALRIWLISRSHTKSRKRASERAYHNIGDEIVRRDRRDAGIQDNSQRTAFPSIRVLAFRIRMNNTRQQSMF